MEPWLKSPEDYEAVAFAVRWLAAHDLLNISEKPEEVQGLISWADPKPFDGLRNLQG